MMYLTAQLQLVWRQQISSFMTKTLGHNNVVIRNTIENLRDQLQTCQVRKDLENPYMCSYPVCSKSSHPTSITHREHIYGF